MDLIGLSIGKYTCNIFIFPNKEIFGNWIEKIMCKDYSLFNKKRKSNCYPMLILKELFDTIEFDWVFSVLDLKFGYHKLPLPFGNIVKIPF